MKQTITLANQVEMPLIGLGTWEIKNQLEDSKTVQYALNAGYQAIDTAAIYHNEEAVGRALKNSPVDRKELFITTKVYDDEQGYAQTHRSFQKSLERLQLDYIDLFLIHWPVTAKYHETWRAMEELYASGQVRAIGVSNFHSQHIEDLLTTATITPMVNQIELHPQLNQRKLVEYCRQKGIVVTAYSPLGRGALLENPLLKKIARTHQKSVAQVILRWDLQNGLTVIPKSANPERIAANLAVFDFALTPFEMSQIDQLNTGERLNKDPDSFILTPPE